MLAVRPRSSLEFPERQRHVQKNDGPNESFQSKIQRTRPSAKNKGVRLHQKPSQVSVKEPVQIRESLGKTAEVLNSEIGEDDKTRKFK